MPTYLTVNAKEKCVMARIRRERQLYQSNFTLKQFGSYEAATRAAREWVDVRLAELPPALPIKGRMTHRNSSGVVGVRLADATRRKNGNVYPDWRWVANWPGCRKVGGVGWSVNHYSDDRAFVCAFIARENEIDDRVKVESNFLKIFNSVEYADILKLKIQSPPAFLLHSVA